MKIKCFWQAEDIKPGLRIMKQAEARLISSPKPSDIGKADIFMIIAKGDKEFSVLNLETGELVMTVFMQRRALAEMLTQHEYAPVGTELKL